MKDMNANTRRSKGTDILQQFISEHGRAHPNSKLVYRGYKLGQFACAQRHQHQHGRLAKERVQLLESLPGWTWKGYEAKWVQNFQKLVEYVQVRGHASPMTKEEFRGYKIGVFVSVQRQTRRNGTLSPQRARKLEALPGWKWQVYGRGDSPRWDEYFSTLQDFVSAHGAYALETVEVHRGIDLGFWVRQQKAQYLNGRLLDDRAAALELVPGWTWDQGLTGHANQLSDEELEHINWYARFVQYKQILEGDVLPAQLSLDVRKWAVAQHTALSTCRLSSFRRAELESLPGRKKINRKVAV